MKNVIYVESSSIQEAIHEAANILSPVWSLNRAIACNPLQGLEELLFEEAVSQAAHYLQQPALPEEMKSVNREVIKWCQLYTDEGQATFAMPGKNERFYTAWKALAAYEPYSCEFIRSLPLDPEEAIAECLFRLHIEPADHATFLTLMFSTLPGWPSYLQQHTDFLAVKLAITCALWPNAQTLLTYYPPTKTNESTFDALVSMEQKYKDCLLTTLKEKPSLDTHVSLPQAQMVFCIDVRSEPLRRALEAQGDIETFGFAGFFGIPMAVKNDETGEAEDACPVLIASSHVVEEKQYYSREIKKHIERFYESLKYTFTTPFTLAEALGPWFGLWMMFKTAFPKNALSIGRQTRKTLLRTQPSVLSIEGIPLDEQCDYAQSALSAMGLTSRFAPIVMFCGHASTTQNNPHAAGLDCGACGGRPGGVNAKVLAKILNTPAVRSALQEKGITIPAHTRFVAAEHNTTRNTLTVFDENMPEILTQKIARATDSNNQLAAYADWAETRPEWGLARNASFIVAPRKLTQSINLEGRAFLHSYVWEDDPEGKILEVILTAPMVVAQWINTQYLFSTRDNIAYGCGNKTTHNVTGKVAVMQGNGSDLMHGLSLQSIAVSDTAYYHEPIRLLTVILAPTDLIDEVIKRQPVLQKLFGNGWVQLSALSPQSGKVSTLNRDFTWTALNQ